MNTPKTTTTKRISDPSSAAAQAKVWRAERKTLHKAARKVMADFETERKRLSKLAAAAQNALNKHHLTARPKMDRACAQIDRRIGILNGRLGL